MKRKKKAKNKVLQVKAEKLMKEIIALRDGNQCMVQKYYPNIKIAHSEVYQADHCFSRTIKELFLDLANLTMICSTCNAAKGSNKIAVSKRDAITVAVHEIVKKREGEDTYNRLLEVASGMSVFKQWGQVWWLEEQIAILEEIKSEFKWEE